MNCSWIILFDQMLKGKFEGFFAWGRIPPVRYECREGQKGARKPEMDGQCKPFRQRDRLFLEAPGLNPADIKTEVFMRLRLHQLKGREHNEQQPSCAVERKGDHADRGIKA
jgi:hypothetical protein